jgi:hypothetical protein
VQIDDRTEMSGIAAEQRPCAELRDREPAGEIRDPRTAAGRRVSGT